MPNDTARIRLLLADDHPVLRDGLQAILDTDAEFEVVAQAGSGAEAVRLAEARQPDVILMDLEMPDLDGVEAIRRIRAARPDARILVFTAFDTDERILGALQAGAQGYLLKGAPREELFRAIRVVHGGGSLLHPVVASKVLRHMSGPAPESLTERELEVLRLLARGLQNKEIAATLHISERTAKFHVSSILGKLGAGNRTEAVRLAAQQGLIQLS
jgi:two-component system, NarL family, response regulator LiaR